MLAIVMIVAGIALIIGTVKSFLFGKGKTPGNLRGYYGKSYGWTSLCGIFGGITLIVLSFFTLI